MDYITIETLHNLKSVGFSYPEYEHLLNRGMIYYYEGTEYFVGGFSNNGFTPKDIEVVRSGVWLPTAIQLMKWLNNTDFIFTLTSDENDYYTVLATDTVNGARYKGGGLTSANALAKTIFKICKSHQREYKPRTTLRLSIIGEADDREHGDSSLVPKQSDSITE